MLKRHVEFDSSFCQSGAYVNSGFACSLFSDELKQSSGWHTCKAYLQDDYLNYYLEWTAGTPPATASFNLCIINPANPKFSKHIHNIRNFIHQIERKLKIRPTRLYEVANIPLWMTKKKTTAYMLNASKIWAISPVMVSLYSLAARTGSVHNSRRSFKETIVRICRDPNVEIYHAYDRQYWQNGAFGLSHFIKYGVQNVFGTDPKKNWTNEISGCIHGLGISEYSNHTYINSRLVQKWTDGLKYPAIKVDYRNGIKNYKFPIL